MRKAILIGLGGMGQRYVKALSQLNFKLVGICDQKKDKLKKSRVLNVNSFFKFIKHFFILYVVYK